MVLQKETFANSCHFLRSCNLDQNASYQAPSGLGNAEFLGGDNLRATDSWRQS